MHRAVILGGYIAMATAACRGDMGFEDWRFRVVVRQSTVAAVTIDTRGGVHVPFEQQRAPMYRVLIRLDHCCRGELLNLIGQLLIFMALDTYLHRVLVVGA